MDECLTVQGFQFGLTHSAANGHKFTRHQHIKTEKDIGVPSETILHNGTSVGKMVHDTQGLQQQHIAPTYMMGDGGYYTAALGCNGHINPSSPGTVMMASPCSTTNQCSPSVINPQVADCYKSTLLGVMNAYLPTYSSASSDVHAANPTSPMQTSYTHVQSGFPLEGTNTMHSVPPPNYTEATSMTGDMHYGHFPPNYDSIMTASEYPATLPKTHIS